MIDNNNNTNEKVMLSGRVEASDKEFIDGIWDKSKGETFSDAIKKLRESYTNRAVKIEGLDLTADREFLNKCIQGIQASIKAIAEKTEIHLTEQSYNVENRLTEKDILLKCADDKFKLVEDEYKLQLETLQQNLLEERKINDKHCEDYSKLEKDFEKINEELENKKLTINALLEEKRNLSSELADNRAKATELQNTINDLHALEVENKTLKDNQNNLKESIREYKSEVSILNTKLETTNINLNSIRELNNKLNVEIENLKQTKANFELEHKKALIDLERSKEIEYNNKLEATLKDIKSQHEQEINELKEKLFLMQMELKQLKK